MQITISDYRLPTGGAVVVGVLEGGALTAGAQALDRATGGAITRAIAAGRFDGKRGQWLELVAPGDGKLDRVLLAGLGQAESLDLGAAEAVGGGAVQKLITSGVSRLGIVAGVAPIKGSKHAGAEVAAHVAFGARLGGHRFDKYRTTLKPNEKPSLGRVTVLTKNAAAARRAFRPLDALADGVFLTRDLVSEPANVLYPESFAREIRKLSRLGLKIQVLNEAQMRRLGMGALLGVGQGSTRESRLAVMQWNGGGARARPVAFVGKGVCFDTGGISIKPAAGMEAMKWDMGGAGTVTGLMAALAGRKAKVNAVGVVGLVENMPSGEAQRPGDVVKSMSGQTIEVINTDAEGRLVLADALWYTQKRFRPQFMVDLATLTGAMIVALGHEHAGLFANNDELAERLTAAGKAEGEPVWRMPMGEAYDKLIRSDIADMKNVGGRDGGSITAAQLLERFVNQVPWAHLDIAGVAWSNSAKPTVPKGGSGWGVRLLNRLVQEHYETR
jgi:leucyl aminopeptidase